MALIRVRNPHIPDQFDPVCAGAILSPENILTNAVCACACKVMGDCKIYVGRTNVDQGGREVQIKNTVWHESYVAFFMIKLARVGSSLVIDLGMIHIGKIKFSPTISNVQLTRRELINGRTVRIAGWGNNDVVRSFTFECSQSYGFYYIHFSRQKRSQPIYM